MRPAGCGGPNSSIGHPPWHRWPFYSGVLDLNRGDTPSREQPMFGKKVLGTYRPLYYYSQVRTSWALDGTCPTLDTIDTWPRLIGAN